MQTSLLHERYGSFSRLGDDYLAPRGPIAVITSQIDPVFSDQVNYHMRNLRAQHILQDPDLEAEPGYFRADYRIQTDLSRFDTGEGRAAVLQTVRGHDLYIITDVLNYGQYYTRFNQTVSKAPDEHFTDLTRLIQTTRAAATRVNVIMPYLYEGRRYRRQGRESLDCGTMLKHLFALKIDNFITFDAHDSRVANAVPRKNFETFPTAYPIIDGILSAYPELEIDPDHLMIISPDETSISRGIFYASTLKVPLGIFYRRRDFSRDNGLIETSMTKQFLGDNVEGKDCVIIDDSINTGATMLESAKILKSLGANRVFCVASFAIFTSGFEAFNQAHDMGIIERVFATNLTYCPPVVQNSPWFYPVNMTKKLAGLIDALNHNASLSTLLAPSKKIEARIELHNKAKANRS